MKKVLAIMLVCFMLVSLLPMGALAAEVEQDVCPFKGETHYKQHLDEKEIGYEVVREIEGECGEYSYTIYACDECGEYFADNFVKVDGKHNFEVVQNPKHSKDGIEECTICGKTQSVKCEGKLSEKVGNCVDGWTATCDTCGETVEYKAGEHKWGVPFNVTGVDEKNFVNGTGTVKCELCGKEETVVVQSHNCAEKLELVETVPATCTEAGTLAHEKCAICGRTFIDGMEVSAEDLAIPATKHPNRTPIITTEEYVFDYYDYEDNSQFFTAPLTGTYAFTHVDGSSNYAYATVYDANGYRLTYVEYFDTYYIDLEAGETVEVRSSYGFEMTIEWSVDEIRVEGDCFNKGTTTTKCADCGELIVEEDEDFAHVYKEIFHSEAGCETIGWTILACQNPECQLIKTEKTEALGHTFPAQAKDTNRVEPTCVEDGYLWWNCERCDEEQRHTLPATGCEFVTVTVDATCSQYGYTYTYCAKGRNCDCEETKEDRYSLYVKKDGKDYTIQLGKTVYALHSWDIFPTLDAENHNQTDRKNGMIKPELCTQDGLYIYICRDCKQQVIETVPATGHDIEGQPTEYSENRTCAEPGYTYVSCKDCGEELNIKPIVLETKTYYTMAEAFEIHGEANLDEKNVLIAGDCKNQGVIVYECTLCGEILLVIDENTGSHREPADLMGRFDENNPEPELIEGSKTFEGDSYKWFYFEVEADCVVTITADCSMGYLQWGSEDDYVQEYIDGTLTKEVEVTAGTFGVAVYAFSEYKITCEYMVGEKHLFKGQDATCTEPGWTASFYCECGEYIASEEIPAKNHANRETSVEYVAPTCELPGVQEAFVCLDCGYEQETAVIRPLGHETSKLLGSAEFVDGKTTGYELWQCEREDCGVMFVTNYKQHCVHEYNRRADEVVDATCTKEGSETWFCLNCGMAKTITTDRLHHTNASGRDLEVCGPETTDLKCATCDFKVEEGKLPVHDYKATGEVVLGYCLSDSYELYICANEGCLEPVYAKVIEALKGTHKLGEWTAIIEDGKILGQSRGCSLCDYKEERIAFTSAITNAANAEMGISTGSKVAVTISTAARDAEIWGFRLNVPYDANLMTFAGFAAVEGSLYTSIIAEPHVNEDGSAYITIVASADGNVALKGEEAVIELYFDVVAAEASELWVNITDIEALVKNEKNVYVAVDAGAYGTSAKTVVLMDLNGDGKVNVFDAAMMFELIKAADNTNVAADLNKDGKVNAIDYAIMFEFLAGKLSVEDVAALGNVVVEEPSEKV